MAIKYNDNNNIEKEIMSLPALDVSEIQSRDSLTQNQDKTQNVNKITDEESQYTSNKFHVLCL